MAASSAGRTTAVRQNCSVNGSENSVNNVDGQSEWSMDESEGEQGGITSWQTTSRKRGEKRRKDRSSNSESSGRGDDCFKCVIRFGEAGGVSKKNPIKLTKVLNDTIGRIEFARVLPDGNLLVGCTDLGQVGKALKVKSIGGVKVVSANRIGVTRAKSRKGVITKVPVGIGMEEFMENIKGGNVLSAYRMKSWFEGTKIDTETVVLEFQDVGKSLFADDGALWKRGRHLEHMKVQMQEAINKVEQWGKHLVIKPHAPAPCIMSIDFDSAALQTQHDEDEYDQEDYAREQELHKLLTDLPDDMLEDSRDSSPDLEYSICSNKNTGNSPQTNGAQQWSNHVRPTSNEQNYEANYNQFPFGERAVNGHLNGHQGQTQPHVWHQAQGPQFTQGDYSYNSIGTDNNDFSTDDYGAKAYPEGSKIPVEYNGNGGFGDRQVHGETGNHFQVFNSKSHQGQEMDQLQREFLDSTAKTADQEQLAQLRILHKAQQRQIEDLEQKLEDSRRNMRYLEHQFAIVKDEKDGLAVSLKESSCLIEEYKGREVKMQKNAKALEHQVQLLTEKDQENMKKQRVADAAVDTMKQQMLDMCRSDTLSRAREQHDRDITVLREQHDTALLASKQKIDSISQALDQQVELTQKLREQVKQLERQREEDQLERARVINGLTQRLEESQQQCAKLLQTSSVQEMSQLQIKLQQTQSAKTLSENMNKALQEDLAELKEQITLYESAVKHNVISLDLHNDLENHLSESCIDLGLKKTNLRNGTVHNPLAKLSDSKLPKDEALRLLRAEMQRCLANLKGKRQKIEHLQETSGETGQTKITEVSGPSQEELKQLEGTNNTCRNKWRFVSILEKKYKELKQNEEKVKAANLELCTKMREMIQELDQEKQEAAERSERVHQQHRDDVVKHVRTELIQEHTAQIEQLTQQHQQQLQELQTQLSEAHDKMSAVQECYISVCKEKDTLEESIRSKDNEEATLKETKQKMQEETDAALKKLRVEMEAQHQASVAELKAVWTKDKEKEIQQNVDMQVAQINATWKEEMKKMERNWSQKLEEANRQQSKETAEAASQTNSSQDRSVGIISVEELESRLTTQKQQLQTEADRAKMKAVEEAKKQVQKDLHEKHLEDMAKQVEGAVTRAYNRWVEDLTSLPEYQASLQSEREKWEEQQQSTTDEKVSQAVRAAEDRWAKRQRASWGAVSSQQEHELQQTASTLQSQLDQTRKEQAALLKAELSAARAAWNRDKLQEINLVQARSEQAYQSKLQEQQKKLHQALQRVKEEAELEKKDLISQTEARLQQAVESREQELNSYFAEKEKAQMKDLKDEIQAEIQAALAQIQTQLFMKQQGSEEAKKTSREPTGGHHNNSTFMSEGKLSLVLKETQEQYEKEILKIQASASQRAEQGRCRKECTQTVSNLQKKNQELQRHLEKACRQLQSAVREHKAAVKKLKGDMMRYLQESRERAAEMIRVEVHYYLTCLQELLEDGGQTTGAEKKIMNAASKLAAMAKVLETPVKNKSGKNYALPCGATAVSDGLSPSVKKPDFDKSPLLDQTDKRLNEKIPKQKTSDFNLKPSATERTKLSNERDPSAPVQTPNTPSSYRTSQQKTSSHCTDVVVRSKIRDIFLQGHVSESSCDPKAKTFLQELPVREEKRSTDWSLSSNDSETGLQIPRLSTSGRKVEPVKPFSVASNCNFGEFGGLTPDTSDLTVYNEIVKKTPNIQNSDFYTSKSSMSATLTNRQTSSRQNGSSFSAKRSETGDVVALFSENSPMFVWLWLGLAKIGCVGAFINCNIRSKSLLHCVKISGAKLLVAAEGKFTRCSGEILPGLQEQQVSVFLLSDKCRSSHVESFTQEMDQASSAPLPPNIRSGLSAMSPAVYIYTSGTTGLPKATPISHARLWVITLFHISMGRSCDEILYVSLPLYHTVAFLGITGAIEQGSTVALRTKFSVSNFWTDCRKYNATVILYIGETMRYLCNVPKSPNDRNHSVRCAIGNGTRPDVWREFLQRFGDIKITEFYGMTEGNCSFTNLCGKIGAIGRKSFVMQLVQPYAFIKFDVDREEVIRDASGFCIPVQTGEPGLMVSKITLLTPFPGYVGDLKQTESKRIHNVFKEGDVYFNSGDLLWEDKEGFVYFHDRVGDTFRWKGENVATTEVGDILSTADCIEEANVYGVSVPGHEGRVGMAAVALKEGSKFDTAAVFKVMETLPVYARPLFIRIQESLAVTGTFKYQKRKLTDEGFNPKAISDPLYFLDLKKKDYVPLTLNIYDSLVTGAIKI
ncbi:hypothetical protein WMY93_023000 [Mugilogobius chulae]|uniref:long-chain-fatty-acid--CoA ligase n=1 Tax=Mugilogobius chulae TaxID=88201 RepID=A0AAW0N8K6_9GOBI